VARNSVIQLLFAPLSAIAKYAGMGTIPTEEKSGHSGLTFFSCKIQTIVRRYMTGRKAAGKKNSKLESN